MYQFREIRDLILISRSYGNYSLSIKNEILSQMIFMQELSGWKYLVIDFLNSYETIFFLLHLRSYLARLDQRSRDSTFEDKVEKWLSKC